MDQKYLDLYGEYARGRLDRRSFLKRLAVLAGSTAAAVGLLPVMEEKYTQAQMVPENDGRMDTEYIQYPGAAGEVRAYSARPKGDEKLAGVIVIHENRGLQPHIEDVARRAALEGFMAVAPDALSPLGGTPEDVDEARSKMGKLDRDETVKNFAAAVKYLKTNPQTTGKVGCMGFCWGGGVTNQVAVHAPELDAAVPFYGSQPETRDVSKIEADMLIHYAGLDDRINAGIPEFKAALEEAGVDYQIYMYEGARHAFFNDSNPDRYHEEAAKLAWTRTIAFFKDKLT
jgi:carboxymethylenebutenolidase